MANQTRKKKRSFSIVKQLLLITLSAGFGYFFSVVVDYKQLTHWFSKTKQSFVVNNEVNLPPPKLEFYTLLTKPAPAMATHSAAASPLKSAIVAVALPTASAHDGYVVQVASFQRPQDAERLKAALIMSGFEVQVQTVAQQRVNWYRVVLGPFASRADAQQMLALVARKQRIVGIIRKMDV